MFSARRRHDVHALGVDQSCRTVRCSSRVALRVPVGRSRPGAVVRIALAGIGVQVFEDIGVCEVERADRLTEVIPTGGCGVARHGSVVPCLQPGLGGDRDDEHPRVMDDLDFDERLALRLLYEQVIVAGTVVPVKGTRPVLANDQVCAVYAPGSDELGRDRSVRVRLPGGAPQDVPELGIEVVDDVHLRLGVIPDALGVRTGRVAGVVQAVNLPLGVRERLVADRCSSLLEGLLRERRDVGARGLVHAAAGVVAGVPELVGRVLVRRNGVLSAGVAVEQQESLAEAGTDALAGGLDALPLVSVDSTLLPARRQVDGHAVEGQRGRLC